MKKTVKALLISTLLAVMLAVFSLAANAVSAGSGISWNFRQSDGVLTISGSGAMTDFDSAEDAPWFSVRGEINKISFSGSITHVGNNAFRSCTVQEISFPSGLKSVGASAFEDCFGLKSITLPQSVTSVGDFAFANNCSVKTVSGGDNVQTVGSYAFYRCSTLTAVTIPAATASVGEYAFAYCTALKTVDIAQGLVSLGRNAFYFCPALTGVELPDTLQFIGESAFEGDRLLASVALGNGVTEIGDNAFYKCMKLVSITGGDALENVGKRAFFASGYYNDESNWSDGILYIGGCAVAGSYTCPVVLSVKGGTNSIADGAFAGNETVMNITFPSSLKRIGDHAFSNCTDLLIMYYNGSNTEWSSNVEIGEGNSPLAAAKKVFGSYSMAGDINDDKLINAKDSVLLAQYLARWDVYVNQIGADCNGDGVVNAKDSVLLAQYLANWDVELKNPGGNTGDYGGDVDIPSDGIFGSNSGDVDIPADDLLG